jgi:hypothetical protein
MVEGMRKNRPWRNAAHREETGTDGSEDASAAKNVRERGKKKPLFGTAAGGRSTGSIRGHASDEKGTSCLVAAGPGEQLRSGCRS